MEKREAGKKKQGRKYRETSWVREMRGDIRGFAGSLSIIQDVSQQIFTHTGTCSKPSITLSQGRTPQTLQIMFQHHRDVAFHKSFFCMDPTDAFDYFELFLAQI